VLCLVIVGTGVFLYKSMSSNEESVVRTEANNLQKPVEAAEADVPDEEEDVSDSEEAENSEVKKIKAELAKEKDIVETFVSFNNKYIAYLKEDDSYSQLYLWAAGEKNPQLIEGVAGRLCEIYWSPNSEYFFVDEGTGVDRSGWIISAKEKKVLAGFEYIHEPLWSPDSKYLALAVFSKFEPITLDIDLRYTYELVLYDALTQEKKVIAPATSEYSFHPTKWEKNGTLFYEKYSYVDNSREEFTYKHDLSEIKENDKEAVGKGETETVVERYLPPEKDYNKKYSNTPIYGLYSIIFSSTRDFNDKIKELSAQIGYEPEEEGWNKPDDVLQSLIESDPLFQEIKSTTNTMYSLYSLEGKIGEYYGQYTRQPPEYFVDYILFDEDAPDGFFISGTQNHMPRPVKVLVNCKLSAKERDFEIRKLQDFAEEKLLDLGRQLIGDEREVVIAQYLECDLNNDQKIERIVNYNNFIPDPDVDEYLIGAEDNSWQKKYYSIQVILDEDYQPLGYIQKMPDFSGIIYDLGAYDNGQTAVQYIVDIDNDGQMEIISFQRGWEYDNYIFSKLTEEKVESYYQRYFWVYY